MVPGSIEQMRRDAMRPPFRLAVLIWVDAGVYYWSWMYPEQLFESVPEAMQAAARLRVNQPGCDPQVFSASASTILNGVWDA